VGEIMTDQMTLDELMMPELILCSLSEGYHWIRITQGCTPVEFIECVQFKMDGYDYIYENTPLKDEIISAFEGTVRSIPFAFGQQ